MAITNVAAVINGLVENQPLASNNLSASTITASSTIMATGAITASNFSGSSSGTNTGDQTITLTGDVTGSGTSSFAATISASAVTLAKMANLPANTFIGNNTGVSATPLALTSTQATAMLNLFTSSLQGVVPASGGGTTTFLRADGTFATPPGTNYTFADSLVNTAGTVTLVNDTATPTASTYYGTDVTSTLGYHALPSGVTSVALADGSAVPIYSISGSPVTSTGTLTFTLNSQTANTVFASPNGSSGQPTFRTLVVADIPNLSGTYLPLTGGTLSGALNLGGNAINNIASPSLSTDAANKGYVDSAINGLTWKGPVQAYAASNTALTGGSTLTIDGYSVQNGNNVILGNQTIASQNYVYVASGIGTAYTLTPVTGFEAPTAIGDAYLVENGTSFGNSAFQVNAITPNTTFIQFAGPNSYTFSPPLSLTGNTVSISQATTSTNGYLSSTDWNTFNSKQSALTFSDSLVNTGGTVTLVGDNPTPAANEYYGTNGSSVLGYYAFPSGGANTSLSNLTSTSVNQTLFPSSNTKNLGGQGAPWGGIYGNSFTAVTSGLGDAFDISAGNYVAPDGITYTGGIHAQEGTTFVIFTNSNADTTSTADLAIETGNQTGTSGNSGNVILRGGVSTNGTSGKIRFENSNEGTAGYVWTSTDTLGSGSWQAPSSSSSAVTKVMTAGQTFAANTSYLVRMGITSNSETANRVYAADNSNAATNLQFWVVGIANSPGGVSAGGSITVTLLGSYSLASADAGFTSGTEGQAVWLTTSGAFSTTAPSASGTAAFKVGTVETTGAGTASSILINGMQLTGVN